jgi:hypothetical protein
MSSPQPPAPSDPTRATAEVRARARRRRAVTEPPVVSGPPEIARPRRQGVLKPVVGGLVAIAIGVGLVVAVANLAADPDSGVEINLGVDVFTVGDVTRWSAEIAESGPLLFPDASPARSRDVYVGHAGGDPQRGWAVFDARRPGTGRECTFEVDRDTGELADPCTGEPVSPLGEGLTQYAWRIDANDVLIVDLTTRIDPATGDTIPPSTAPASPTTAAPGG